MALLSAAFLAGIALIAIPIWLHRLRAHAAEQQAFSSLFLMRRSEAPVNMQRRLQHLFLLALRIALLVLVCLAFAEPVLEVAAGQTADAAPADHLIVIDNSLSMSATQSGRSALEQAKGEARQLIEDMPFASRAAVVAAGEDLELATSLTADRTQLDAAIAAIRQSSGRLAFDGLSGRLAGIASALIEPGESLHVHVFSDFQLSAMPDQFNALVANAAFPMTLHRVSDATENWTIEAMHLRQASGAAGAQPTLEVVVSATAADPQSVPLSLRRNGREVGSLSVTVGDSRVQTVSFPVELDSREARVWEADIAVDDALPVDNVRYLARPVSSEQTLPVLGANDRAFTYISAAIGAALPRFTTLRTRVAPVSTTPVVLLDDPGGLPGDVEAGMRAYLEDGGAVFMTAGVNTRAAGRLAIVDAEIEAGRITQDSYGVVAVDRTHPVLTSFADWRSINVFQIVRLLEAGQGQTILSLDDGSPLLIEYRIGAGRLLLLTTALDPEWSSLVVQPAFVNFLAHTVNYLAEELLPSEAIVGQPFAIPTQAVQLFDAAGTRVLGLSDTVDRPAVSLDEPGLYEVRTPSRSQPLAVNTDIRESRLGVADADLLQAWQDATQEHLQDEARRATKAGDAGIDAVKDMPLAPWLLLALLLVVLVECVTANLFTRRAREAVV